MKERFDSSSFLVCARAKYPQAYEPGVVLEAAERLHKLEKGLLDMYLSDPRFNEKAGKILIDAGVM